MKKKYNTPLTTIIMLESPVVLFSASIAGGNLGDYEFGTQESPEFSIDDNENLFMDSPYE